MIVSRAVVGVPTDFSSEAKAAVRRLFRTHGCPTVVLLQEPVAAALAHGLGQDRDAEELILVVDLGGGTCDVSLVEVFDGILEVVATAGDAALGGSDVTAALAHAAGLPSWRVAEDVKVQLTEREEVEVEVAGKVLVVTRTDLERASAEVLARVAEGPLRRVGEEAGVAWAWTPWGEEEEYEDVMGKENMRKKKTSSSQTSSTTRWAPPPRRVTRLVFVGGATRMPALRGMCERMAGVEAETRVDPEHAVALGAAVHAAVLEGDISGLEVMDGAYCFDIHGRASGWPAGEGDIDP